MESNGRLSTRQPDRIKVLVVFGTRPEAIKMAPVIRALNDTPAITVKTIVSAQHRQMLDQVLALFGINPEYDLNIMTPDQTLTKVTSRVIEGLEPILAAERPDLLMVHGDTTTTFASSLAAFYHKIPVAHVEAGLRTGDRYQPFPEEVNRLLTSKLSDIHFAPTLTAQENLIRENIPAESVLITGNTVIDALFYTLNTLTPTKDQGLRRTVLVTAHRRENWGERLENIVSALDRVIKAHPEVDLLIPVHLNPVVRETFNRVLGGKAQVRLVEPFDYRDMVGAMAQSYMVVTDSGGIQEEAPALGKPVLVLREKTERPEAVTAGTVKLVGTDRERIFQAIEELLVNPDSYRRMAQAVNPYGDGKACARIVAGIKYYFGLNPQPPEEFRPDFYKSFS